MKREIKFRIWDTEDMIYPDQSFNFRNAVFWNIKTTGEKTIKLDTLNYQNLMQFTGLKDKNGVEIYDKDIIKFHYFYEDFIDMGIVEAEKEITAIVEITEFGVFLNTGNENDSAHVVFYNPHEESFEVIGNIHENPELL